MVQGHKRLRKGYGNHILGILNALASAILANRTAVLGLDGNIRELNTPHLRYDEAIWTVEELRDQYLGCGCTLHLKVRPDVPLWHSQRQIAHLLGTAVSERHPIAVEPSTLGLRAVLGTQIPLKTDTIQVCSNPGSPKGTHFLKESFLELLSLPNVYGILAYAFLRPSPEVQRYLTARQLDFDVGLHLRVNLHVGKSSHGSSFLESREKAWRLVPLEKTAWIQSLTEIQLPKLLPVGTRVAIASDQPQYARYVAKKLTEYPTTILDANATADTAMSEITAAENDGRFMIRAADWGTTPRWASLADLYLLSLAKSAIACAGPYSPSTFCQLAAAIAAVRHTLDDDDDSSGRRSTWHQSFLTSTTSSLFWCPAEGPPRASFTDLPPCCETVLLDDSSSSSSSSSRAPDHPDDPPSSASSSSSSDPLLHRRQRRPGDLTTPASVAAPNGQRRRRHRRSRLHAMEGPSTS